MHIRNVIKVTFKFAELRIDIITQRVGDFDMMTSKVDLHISSSLYY
ncbi:hypothetical protein ALT1644_60065 [Alteromonas macleodii]